MTPAALAAAPVDNLPWPAAVIILAALLIGLWVQWANRQP